MRKLKKQKTRQALIEAAMELFELQGYEATTVDQIAEKAKVSRRTFFRYFPSKDFVAFPHHDFHMVVFRKLLARSGKGGRPFDAVKQACSGLAREFMSDAHEHLKQQKIINSSTTLITRGNELDFAWEDLIADALIQRTSKSAEDVYRAELVAGAAMGVIRATLKHWYENGCVEDIETLGHEALALLEKGIAL